MPNHRWPGYLPLISAAIVATTACAPSAAPADPAPAPAESGLRCEAGDTPMVRDVIYFGRNRPDGGTVSDAEWEAYLDSVVTPRFPAGFTVVEAQGHWRGESGVVERERTEVLTLLHTGDEASREAVRALIEEYVRRFHQEAVLRERLAACARF
jgi:Protein of unknown function (DUF3574)